MRYLLILLVAWLPLLCCAVDFDESTQSLPLGRVMQVFEDVDGTATIDDVSGHGALVERFQRHGADVLNAGYSTSAFWLKVDLHYAAADPAAQRRSWLLELAYPPMDNIELYEAGADGTFRLTQKTGDALPYSVRQIKQNNYVFDLPFQPGEQKTVYLRLQSQGSVQAPLTLWSTTAYMEEQPTRIYVLGAIYGVLLGMVVYNLFIFISVRDRSYLFYILYIASFGLYQLSVNGAAVEFLWPQSPWWANASTPFLIGAAALFGCQFSRSFLQTADHSRGMDRLLFALMLCGTVVMVLSLASSYALALRLATVLALAFTVVIFTAGILAWRRGLRQARYFIIAWSAFLLGGIVNTLMVLGHLPNVFLTMYASQLGSALEVMLLSLALADRINTMRDQQSRILLEAGHKLEVLNQQLANSNRLKDEFLATVTHELRTPMNGVIGSLELMQTVPMVSELEQYQQTAAGSARDMMRMVDDILILTELQAGKLYPQHEPFSLQVLLDSMQMQFARPAQSKGLAFSVQMDPSLPERLQGDSKKLALCLNCLLDNAFKFTRQGSVRLELENQGVQGDSVQLCFRVSDSGIGFSHLDENTLYQRFYQVDGSMTREHGGLGIGLAICRQLAELMDGRLQHFSTKGQGSTFELTVRLGLVEAHPLPARSVTGLARPAGYSARRSAQECTLLLVDDNSVNQLVLRGMLLKLGYRVRTAEDGLTALELLQAERFDAVVLDCQMPLTDAFATCRRLRDLPGHSHIPVLAIISGQQRGERERCMEAGMTECIARPVRFEDLQRLLHGWLLARAAGESV
ncbi:7TM diverse intracellular signaling domain-containing protein [Pseudomonas sp. HR96]|uniref:hybrid sensor histidine kinase/response regulator n=1 Tax=Pseudomonas sp. HR96 TaxID=1027966 RepID=UPI002A75A154|nr:7TM diverse intracellular signaling domain-containing protein [Pseudomonas sp. HR96]WPO99418.1 7TM diverse intracellular signaling domain-containing protein [Pseudomonas sp. HR96]